jgi:hypothetical protein
MVRVFIFLLYFEATRRDEMLRGSLYGIALELKRPAKERGKREDEHLWALLAAGPSAFLVTGDRKLIDEPVGGARVMTARAFGDLLGE